MWASDVFGCLRVRGADVQRMHRLIDRMIFVEQEEREQKMLPFHLHNDNNNNN